MAETQRFDFYAEDELASDVREAASDSGVPVARFLRDAARAYVGPSPSPYFRPGTQFSLVQDVWRAANTAGAERDDARHRLDQFSRHQRGQRETLSKTFTAGSTGNLGQIIPPGYRDSPFAAANITDRPLFEASTQGVLTNATPFTLPGTIADTVTDAATGTSATRAEGSNRADGTLTIGSSTVQPVSIDGLYKVTREVFDSANPALDLVAFTVMAESYRRKTEAAVFAELNSVQAGTITSGQVPSGAQARTSTGTALPQDLAKAILNYVDFAKRQATAVVASSRSTVSDALEAVDLTRLAFRNVSVDLSAWITGTAAGDGDVFVIGPDSLASWSSPLLELTYAERSGPAGIDLALFGYFACKVIRPVGISSIRHT